MQITMRETGTRSVPELGSFLSSSDGWELEGKSQTEIYDWVQKEMVAWEYLRQGKKERGVIRAYMEKMTGLPVPRMTRLIRQYRSSGRIARRVGNRCCFPFKYTRQDIALLAGVDRRRAGY
jgi:hypothetical protein